MLLCLFFSKFLVLWFLLSEIHCDALRLSVQETTHKEKNRHKLNAIGTHGFYTREKDILKVHVLHSTTGKVGVLFKRKRGAASNQCSSARDSELLHDTTMLKQLHSYGTLCVLSKKLWSTTTRVLRVSLNCSPPILLGYTLFIPFPCTILTTNSILFVQLLTSAISFYLFLLHVNF